MRADHRLDRQRALAALMVAEGVDALLVTHLPNIRYLTGFSGSAALLLVRPDRSELVTDFRYAAQAPQEVGNAAHVIIDEVNVWERLGRLLAAESPGALGVEGHVLTIRDAERVSSLTRSRVVPTGGLVERLRASKDAGEVACIRAAADLAHAALATTLTTVRVGQTELEIGARLESELRRLGSEWHPFPTIVASGPRSALPHAHSTARAVARGDWLLLDFGAQQGGYCSDITRTFVVGAPADGRQREIYQVVQAAQQRARDGIRPGMTGREADALARDPIAAKGFGSYFGHSLGHGLGLEVHEAPRLSPTADAPLPGSAVVTVEPGIYLPGWGGVRLEDDVLLTPTGPELLTDGHTELIELT